jgi:hypothetical protein
LARVLALVPDLFFASKVEETLRAAGHDVTIVAELGTVESRPAADVLVVDLDQTRELPAAGGGPPRLGFYSHVEAETRRRAEQAGFDLVVPRSRMAREMPQLVASLLDRARDSG